MMALSALRPPLGDLATINDVKEVLIHIRFKYCPPLPKLCYTWQIVQTPMRHRVFIWVCAICKGPLGFFCINALTTPLQMRTLNLRQATPLHVQKYTVFIFCVFPRSYIIEPSSELFAKELIKSHVEG